MSYRFESNTESANVNPQGSRNHFQEYQMPGYPQPGYNDNPYQRYQPPFDPRYSQESQQWTGVLQQRPYHLPTMDIYDSALPIQGARNGIRFTPGRNDLAGGNGFPPETYLPVDRNRINMTDGYNHHYQNQQRMEQCNRQIPNAGTYSGDAMDYMKMEPKDYALDFQDGQMEEGNRLFRRLKFMVQHGQANQVVPFMTEINRNLASMNSPYHLTWQPIGDPRYGNQKLAVTFHGSCGIEPSFQL